MAASYPRIPYGEADFKRIRLNGWLYVDKTRFVHALEDERYVFLIRPRRFGKSCWVSLLDNYYSRKRADDFEEVFGGTHLGRQPTRKPPSLRHPALQLLGVQERLGHPRVPL